MPAAYSNVDLFISTSQWGETYAYTPREANSLGIPVLSYNISGYNEIIDDGVNGKLVESLDEFSLFVKWFAILVRFQITLGMEFCPAVEQILKAFPNYLKVAF